MRDGVMGLVVAVPFLLGMSAAPSDPGHVLFTFHDPEIVESSALVVQDGLFLTSNDSGDEGRVFAVDPTSGDTVGVTHWSDHPTDVEALASAGDGRVWVGDIGDNSASRDSVSVTRIPVRATFDTVDEPSYELVYPDGPHNAETLMADPHTGRLYVATKDVFGGRLFRAPARLDPHGPNRLHPVGDVLPIATDGAFFPDGRHVVLRDYSQAVVYTFPALERVGAFPLPPQDQGEGIAVADDGSVYVSSEGQHEPVLQVSVPASVRRALAPAASSPSDPTSSASQGPGLSASRQGSELPEQPYTGRSAWPWFLTGWIGLGALVVLARSLGTRPRNRLPYGPGGPTGPGGPPPQG